MTREEAIIELKRKITCTIGGLSKEEYNATVMAIEALSADRPTKPILVKTNMILNNEDFERLRLQLIAQNKDIVLLPAGVKECDRPSGEWEYDVDADDSFCTNCHKYAIRDMEMQLESDFCPNCGARMKGGDDE